MPARRWMFLIFAIAIYVAGCGPKPGQPLVTYTTATVTIPPPITADKDGPYALYPDDGISPIARIDLHKGDQLGFRKAENGHIVGFARDKEYDLTAILALDYSWKFVENSEHDKK